MGLWNDANDLGKELQEKRKVDHKTQEMADQAKQAAAEEQRRHEEGNQQGLI